MAGKVVTAEEERKAVVAYILFYMSCWPPFDAGRTALRAVMKDIEDGKHHKLAKKKAKKT